MAERKIGTRFYKTEPVLALKGIVLQARLFKVIGPGMSKMGDLMREARKDAGNSGESEKSAVGTAVLAAVAEVFSQSDPEAVADLLKDIVEMAQIRRPSGIYEYCDFDGDFTGHAQDVYPVALFVIKEQLGDFFTGVPGIGSLGNLLKG